MVIRVDAFLDTVVFVVKMLDSEENNVLEIIPVKGVMKEVKEVGVLENSEEL